MLLAWVWIPRTVSKTATHFWLQGAGLFGWFITEAPALLTNRALHLVINGLNKPCRFDRSAITYESKLVVVGHIAP